MAELIFPTEIISSLARYCSDLGSARRTRRILEQFVKLAFFASLEREEQRAATFTLVLLDPSIPIIAGWNIVPLTTHPKATVGEIVKLASATDYKQTFIAVFQAREGLLIYGLVFTTLDPYRMARGELVEGAISLTFCPRVTVTGPGRLRIGINDVDFATYQQGVVYQPIESVLRAESPVMRALSRLITGSPPEHSSCRKAHAMGAILNLLLQMITDRRHGGTVVIVPDDASLTDDVHVKYRIAGTDLHEQFEAHWLALEERRKRERHHGVADSPCVGSICAACGETKAPSALSRHLLDALNAVADLSQADGAVILGADLKVLGFGAMFKLSNNLPTARQAPERFSQRASKFDLAKLGSRHRSAACFCHQHRGSVAFVVSEDGPVSCMTHVDEHGAIVVWRPMSLQTQRFAFGPRPFPTRASRRKPARTKRGAG